jgi:lipopolysaccharide biosynthesis glycosyltransferase
MKANRTALVTIVIGEKYERLAEVSHPLLKKYAEKTGSDFIVWKDFDGHSLPAYKKLDIYGLLKEYDRVLFIDTDVIIRNDCPNLFELVPETYFGAFNEFPFTDRHEAMMSMCQDREWLQKKIYFNSGVFVCSASHRSIFRHGIEPNNFYEQTLLNFRLHALAIPFFDIGYKFNRMTCLDIFGVDRFDSFIMHYAGCPLETDAFVEQMRSDSKIWADIKDHYPRKIHFDANGGLGDQVCVEPVIRYLKETIYKKDVVKVTTNYPDLFKHLRVEIFDKTKDLCDTRGNFSVNLPPNHAGYLLNNHILTHPVEAASLAAFKGQMPPNCKKIVLGHYPITEELSLLVKDAVLVHPGRSWPTKTFPKEFWLDVIKCIQETGKKVVLIGKEVGEEFGVVDLGKHKIPSLINKLTLNELIGVISEAKGGLVSNDSSPIHIAGAFDNPIHLITIAKADFRILPFRYGGQTYKAFSYGRLIDFPFDPNSIYEIRVDRASSEVIKAHLPNPSEIARNI